VANISRLPSYTFNNFNSFFERQDTMFKYKYYSFVIFTFVISFSAFMNVALAEEHDAPFNEEALFIEASPHFENEFLFEDSASITNENLDDIRGTALGSELLGIAVLDGISANNTSNGTYSGGNIIDTGAFSQSSGLSTIIQNSGNNVVIQSATILTVNID